MERGADREGIFGLRFESVVVPSVFVVLGKDLNVHLIRCSIDQIIVTFVRNDTQGGYRIFEMTILI